jgi:hypothetical protein
MEYVKLCVDNTKKTCHLRYNLRLSKIAMVNLYFDTFYSSLAFTILHSSLFTFAILKYVVFQNKDSLNEEGSIHPILGVGIVFCVSILLILLSLVINVFKININNFPVSQFAPFLSASGFGALFTLLPTAYYRYKE